MPGSGYGKGYGKGAGPRSTPHFRDINGWGHIKNSHGWTPPFRHGPQGARDILASATSRQNKRESFVLGWIPRIGSTLGGTSPGKKAPPTGEKHLPLAERTCRIHPEDGGGETKLT
ncbi:UNVERIFIED_CONTAM: hypothetical protein K2H54_005328 [Gekko kuhli]